MNFSILEYSALAVGTVGTLLWSLGKNQLIVSILWMISAMLWIAFALSNEHYGLTARDGLGVLLYAMGISTYWKERKVQFVETVIKVVKQEPSHCAVCNGKGVHQLSGPGTSICVCRR